MVLINRKQIATILAISETKLSEIVGKHPEMNFPASEEKLRGSLMYDKDKVIEWAKVTEYKNLKWKQNATIYDTENAHLKMAAMWLARPILCL